MIFWANLKKFHTLCFVSQLGWAQTKVHFLGNAVSDDTSTWGLVGFIPTTIESRTFIDIFVRLFCPRTTSQWKSAVPWMIFWANLKKFHTLCFVSQLGWAQTKVHFLGNAVSDDTSTWGLVGFIPTTIESRTFIDIFVRSFCPRTTSQWKSAVPYCDIFYALQRKKKLEVKKLGLIFVSW